MPRRSEREAWEDVAEAARQLQINYGTWTPARARKVLDNIMNLAQGMKAQVDSGVHTNPRGLRRNPALVVWPNPGSALGITFDKLLSRRAYSLAYKHAADRLDYQHDFDPGVDVVTALTDAGQRVVVLTARDGRELWADF